MTVVGAISASTSANSDLLANVLLPTTARRFGSFEAGISMPKFIARQPGFCYGNSEAAALKETWSLQSGTRQVAIGLQMR